MNFPSWCKDNEDTQNKNFNAWLATRVLGIGETCVINSIPGFIHMEVGWDRVMMDVDASAAAFDARGVFVEAVNFNKLESTCGSMTHSGDNRTGKKNGYGEMITINLSLLDLSVHHIILVVGLYKDGMRFIQVPNLKVRVLNDCIPSKGDELFELPLAGRNERAMLVGKLTRQGAYWNFTALATPMDGKEIKNIVKNEQVKKCITAYPSSSPSLRRVQVTVLRGRELTGKDRRFRCWRGRTSDPYYIISFKGQEFRSAHQKKTLEPEWEPRAFDLGHITETEAHKLELTIFDYDKHSDDDFMGVIHIPGNRLYNLGPSEHTFWFNLEQSEEKQYRAEEVSGEILMKFVIKDED